MRRYCFYIDGLNVYHAIKAAAPQYLWLDYGALARNVVGAKDTIHQVLYFTTIARFKRRTIKPHEQYIKALRSSGVETVRGRFMKHQVHCPFCHRLFWRPEEKRTDVNIALHLIRDAIEDAFERAVIVSADSDLLPAIEMVHYLQPDKQVGVMTPLARASVQLVEKADFSYRMSQDLLARSQFPNEIKTPDGMIRKPAEIERQAADFRRRAGRNGGGVR
jgi:uncharacterized LabA/DUF88 family protein